MANTSLPNLTERTATASSDLIHVNSGGTDYKETKANFLSDVNSSITSLNSSLTNSFLIGSKTDIVSSIANFRIGGSTSEILVLAAWINNINAFCIPFTDANGNWYVKVVNWGSSSWSPITSGQITVNYLYKKVS